MFYCRGKHGLFIFPVIDEVLPTCYYWWSPRSPMGGNYIKHNKSADCFATLCELKALG